MLYIKQHLSLGMKISVQKIQNVAYVDRELIQSNIETDSRTLEEINTFFMPGFCDVWYQGDSGTDPKIRTFVYVSYWDLSTAVSDKG